MTRKETMEMNKRNITPQHHNEPTPQQERDLLIGIRGATCEPVACGRYLLAVLEMAQAISHRHAPNFSREAGL
jgi:hypothetical protein